MESFSLSVTRRIEAGTRGCFWRALAVSGGVSMVELSTRSFLMNKLVDADSLTCESVSGQEHTR